MTAKFSSVPSLDKLGCRGDMRDDSAEILFQSFLLEALVGSSGTGRGDSKTNHKISSCMSNSVLHLLHKPFFSLFALFTKGLTLVQ